METLPGTYALILRAQERHAILVGKLGWMEVLPGRYVYLGSAFGPGGLRARVGRHLRGAGVQHWHIDYLRRVTTVEEVWYTLDPKPQECEWAKVFMHSCAAGIPLPGFGSSDCHCPAHLFYLANKDAPDLLNFQDGHNLKLSSSGSLLVPVT